MTSYRIEEGELTLPEGWNDQSMNVFRMSGPAAKDASFVITRDHETPLADVKAYADAQQQVAKAQFPGYQPIARTQGAIDGEPCEVVEYQWRTNASTVLRQRQAYLHLGEPDQEGNADAGPARTDIKPGAGGMLIFTLTSLAGEFAKHEPKWDEVLSSFKRRKDAPLPVEAVPPEAEAANETIEPAPSDPLRHYLFALNIPKHKLQVHANAEQACAAINSLEVEDGLWAFYAWDGAPLQATITTPNRRGVFWSDAGRFGLFPDPRPTAAGLSSVLPQITSLDGLAPLATLTAVREHLERCRAGAPS